MHVLISGAGIAGPTLAWFLARSGARVTILEKADGILPHGQNIDLEGAAVTIVKKMGVLDEIRRLHTTECGTRFIDPKGRPYVSLPLGDGEKFSATSQFEILRGDLAKVLYSASEKLPNVEIHFSTTITKVLSNDEHHVRCELSTGEVLEADILVAADGQWSKVRKQCFSDDEITVVDKNMMCIYWTMPRIPEDNDWWNVYIGLNRRGVTIRPDPHGSVRAMLTCMPQGEKDKQAWNDVVRTDRETQGKFLRGRFSDVGWQSQRLLDSMDKSPDFYFQSIQQIKMSHWSKGRVVCIGDTAHAPTPLTGQGTTLAITGAYVLAGELASLAPGTHPKAAFDEYEAKFKPHVEKMQQIPFIFPGLLHPRTEFQRTLLSLFMRLVKRLADLSIFQRDNNAEHHDNGFPCPTYAALETKVA